MVSLLHRERETSPQSGHKTRSVAQERASFKGTPTIREATLVQRRLQVQSGDRRAHQRAAKELRAGAMPRPRRGWYGEVGRLGDIRAQPLQDLRGASRTGSRLTSRLPTPEPATTEEAESPVSIGISHRKLVLGTSGNKGMKRAGEFQLAHGYGATVLSISDTPRQAAILSLR